MIVKKFFALLLLLGGLSQTSVQAFNHPGVPLSLDDLNYVKAQLAVQPWKSGWDALQASPFASTNYVTNPMLIPISPTNSCVFFRLVYP